MVVVSYFSSWLLCSRLFLVVSSVFGGLSVDKNNDSSTSWLVLVVLCLVCVVLAGMFGNGVSGSLSLGFGSLSLGITFLSFWWAGKWSFLLGPCLSYFVGVVMAYGFLDNFGWFLYLYWGMF